ncbi:MAG: sugar ABC transporter ATP-binding protein [Atopostipes suicloacalis]|nr:sugar ABC transporter ATP-binding protein [Atopostipes suicloacalis]MDN6730856.1 sugar ABC transporter ATP-binding protein [Atopostipes suicloacalis]
MSSYILELEDITKTFPGVKALDGVNLKLKPGTVHALMGENGAGKSTLMKCIFGIYHRDGGTMKFNGEEIKFTSSKEALDAGIAMIHQELQPIKKMTIAENIFLGNYPLTKYKTVDHSLMNKQTQTLLVEVGLNVSATTYLGELTVSQMQLVEIAKALAHNAKIVIMDEPTSSLTENETEVLFEIIERLTKRGIGIIYISHKIDEILQISDDISVLRDGQYIGTWPASEMDNNMIISQMVGRELESLYPEKTNHPSDEVVLKIENFTSPDPLSFKNASFELKSGEVLGVGGLVGAQRTELLEAVYGMRDAEKGAVIHDGKEIKINRPADAIENGIALLTEDRRSTGIFGVLSVSDNVAIASIDQYVQSTKLLDQKAINEVVDNSIDRLDIRTPSNKTRINSLSGGNQQKVIISRWLANNPDILILDEPTRGIDVGAKYEIYEIIDELAAEGKSIIVISSEMPELLGISDRIMVMCDGRISGFLDAETATQEEIMSLATKFMKETV